MICGWGKTQTGKWALMVRGTWHWWTCQKQEKLRAAYLAQRELDRAFHDRIKRD